MINLIYRGQTTVAHGILTRGLNPEGATVTHGGGHSDFATIRSLLREGWLQTRPTGPQGGVRYYTTHAGAAALDKVAEASKRSYTYQAVIYEGVVGYIATCRIDGLHSGKAFGKTKAAARDAFLHPL